MLGLVVIGIIITELITRQGNIYLAIMWCGPWSMIPLHFCLWWECVWLWVWECLCTTHVWSGWCTSWWCWWCLLLLETAECWWVGAEVHKLFCNYDLWKKTIFFVSNLWADWNSIMILERIVSEPLQKTLWRTREAEGGQCLTDVRVSAKPRLMEYPLLA